MPRLYSRTADSGATPVYERSSQVFTGRAANFVPPAGNELDEDEQDALISGSSTISGMRPHVLRDAPRITRDATETRIDMRPDIDLTAFQSGRALEGPPPRAGFVQRWVLDGSMDARDTPHFFQMQRQGWTPRDPASVPPAIRRLFPTAKTVDGSDVIRVAGQVLCEMPMQAARAREAALHDVDLRQRASTPPSLAEAQSKSLQRGGTPIEVNESTQVYRGRPPPGASAVG
jgi:hypothetical protein